MATRTTLLLWKATRWGSCSFPFLVVAVWACLSLSTSSRLFSEATERSENRRILVAQKSADHLDNAQNNIFGQRRHGLLDVSDLSQGNIPELALHPPDEIEAHFQEIHDGDVKYFRHVVPKRSSTISSSLWYGITEQGEEMFLMPFIDAHGNAKYVGTAHIGDMAYDMNVDMKSDQQIIQAIPLVEFDQEEDEEDEGDEDVEALRLDSQGERRASHGSSPLDSSTISQGMDSKSRSLLTSTDEVNLRIIVAWTKKSECMNAGLPGDCTTLNQDTWDLMKAHVDLAVEMTNTAFAESGVYVHLQLVYATRVNHYTEPPSVDAFSHALNALSGTTDGYMDHLHEERERYQAHIVALLIEAPGLCGKSRLGPRKHDMFPVIRSGCATSSLSFAHEIGHLFGCQHDRGSDNACSNSGYNFGFRGTDLRTIMSKSCTSSQCDNHSWTSCQRVARFSTPDISYNGSPIGTTSEDNVRQINENRFEICNYYTCGPIPTPIPTPSPTISFAPTNEQVLGGECLLNGSSSGNMGTWARFDITTDEYGEDTSWELYDETNTMIAFHEIRSYFDNTAHTRFICVPSGHLTLSIHDDWGDGINDPGQYSLCADDEGNCIYGGGSNGFKTDETKILHRQTESPTPSEIVPCTALGYSEKICTELGFTFVNIGSKNDSLEVCGSSTYEGTRSGTCFPGSSTWQQAKATCEGIGARLCTHDEVVQGDTASTGCSFDSNLIWTSTQCAEGSYWTPRGQGGTLRQQCQPAEATSASVRCCADVQLPGDCSPYTLPTEAPTESPITEAPTESPITETPTESPTTETPTESPITETPTESPIKLWYPSVAPTLRPSVKDTVSPSQPPSTTRPSWAPTRGDSTIAPSLSPTRPYFLLLSYDSSRSTSISLEGQIVSGNVFIHTAPDTNVQTVDFYIISDGGSTRTWLKLEKRAAFDLGGTNGDGTAKPWDSSQFSNGSYTMEVELALDDGSLYRLFASFTIEN